MAQIDVVRNCKLLQECLSRLEKMGGDGPKTENGLKQVLKSFAEKPLVSVAEPFHVLHEMLNTYGYIKLNVQYPVTHKVKIAKLKKTLFSRLSAKAKHANGRIIPLPVSDEADEFISDMQTWIDQSVNRNKQKEPIIPAEDFEKQFIKLYMEKQQKVADGAADRILSNLQETGYITLEGDNQDKVSYTFPSSFTLACMKWILGNYKKTVNYGRRRDDENQLSPVVRQINRQLMKIQKFMKGSLETHMQSEVEQGVLSFGVETMNKTEGRSKWERSRSCSPESSSSSSSASSRSSSPDTVDPYAKYLKTHSKIPDTLSYEEKEEIVKRLVGDLKSSSNWETYHFVQGSLATLCQGMAKLQLDDVKLIPRNLTLESIYGLLEIAKMGNNRPKTVKALKNGLKPACRMYYHLDLAILFDDSDREQTIDEDGNEEESRKRKRPMMYSRKKSSRMSQVTLGREIKVREMTTNPNTLFLPDISTLIEMCRADENNQIRKYEVIHKFNEECDKLVDYVSKHSEQLAQHWSSSVVIGDKHQIAAAAGEVYKWLCPGEKSMKCDGEDEAQVKTFTNRDQLLKGIAERCVTLKKDLTVEQLVQRLEADGLIQITEGGQVTYPIDNFTNYMYSHAGYKYDEILRCSWSKYAKIFDDQAISMVNTVMGTSGGPPKARGRKATRGRKRLRRR